MPCTEEDVELLKVGPLVKDNDPPSPSVKVSTKPSPDKVTLPLFYNVIV